MITIKNKQAIRKMEIAGKLLGEVFHALSSLIIPGMSTLELDGLIEMHLKERKLISQCKGYHGYKHVSCISVNDEVVHGVPDATKIIRTGDLVKVDVCASWQGYCADAARCYFIGEPTPAHKEFVRVAQSALNKGIEAAIVGNRLSDISYAIQKEVERHGYGVVRDFAGHGIGKAMHEEPEILNYGTPGKGPLLRSGMSFALEPMITMGNYKVYVTQDGWTVKTVDKSLAAHVEDTVIITESGPKVVTRIPVSR